MRYDEILGPLLRLLFGGDDGAGLQRFILESLFRALIILAAVALIRFRPVRFEQAAARLRKISQNKKLAWQETLNGALPVVANALRNLSYQATAAPSSTGPQYSAAVSR